MPNINVMGGRTMARGSVAARPARSYAKAHTDRRTRFDARASRRYGDWDAFLAFPTALLWLDEIACLETGLDDGNGCLEAPLADLWP